MCAPEQVLRARTNELAKRRAICSFEQVSGAAPIAAVQTGRRLRGPGGCRDRRPASRRPERFERAMRAGLGWIARSSPVCVLERPDRQWTAHFARWSALSCLHRGRSDRTKRPRRQQRRPQPRPAPPGRSPPRSHARTRPWAPAAIPGAARTRAPAPERPRPGAPGAPTAPDRSGATGRRQTRRLPRTGAGAGSTPPRPARTRGGSARATSRARPNPRSSRLGAPRVPAERADGPHPSRSLLDEPPALTAQPLGGRSRTLRRNVAAPADVRTLRPARPCRPGDRGRAARRR